MSDGSKVALGAVVGPSWSCSFSGASPAAWDT